MKDKCQFKSRWDALAEHGEQRDAQLKHLLDCETCRHHWANADPSRLFSLLAHDLPTEETWAKALDNVSHSVSAALDQAEAERIREEAEIQPLELHPAEVTPASSTTGQVSKRSHLLRGALIAAAVVVLFGAIFITLKPTSTTAPTELAADLEPMQFVPTEGTPVEWIETPATHNEDERIDFAIGETQVTLIINKGLEL